MAYPEWKPRRVPREIQLTFLFQAYKFSWKRQPNEAISSFESLSAKELNVELLFYNKKFMQKKDILRLVGQASVEQVLKLSIVTNCSLKVDRVFSCYPMQSARRKKR